MALRMHELNLPHDSIAKTLNVSEDTITNYIIIYQDSGNFENRYYQPTSQVIPYLDEIRHSLKDDPVSSAKDGGQRIEQLTKIRLLETQARRLMKKLWLHYRKAAGIPGKAIHNFNWNF